MKIIKPYVEQMTAPFNGKEFLRAIERAGRTCYKSEEAITSDSCIEFVRKLIKKGHEAMLEHAPAISMKFVCDRGVSHQIVRHRLFSFAQENTRHCNYGGKDIVYILPCWFSDEAKSSLLAEPFHNIPIVDIRPLSDEGEQAWVDMMICAEMYYNRLVSTSGWSPQEARSVLPNSLKTEIIVTGNLREWRHFFRLRTSKTAHPQMQEVANMALEMLKAQIPVVFEDI